MPNLKEIMENPGLLEQEAERVVQLTAEKDVDLDQGTNVITSEEQLTEIFNRIGRNPDINYVEFCNQLRSSNSNQRSVRHGQEEH